MPPTSDRPPPAPSSCRQCGADSSAWGRGGPLRFLDARAAPDLVALFDGSLDTAACPVCGTSGDTVPTTIMVFDSPPGLRLLIGPLMTDLSDFAGFLFQTFGFMSINGLAMTDTPDGFRATVRERLQPQITAVHAIAGRQARAYVRRRRRELTASTFAVAVAALADPPRWPGTGDLAGAEVAGLAWAQAEVWAGVAGLHRAGPDAPALDADLRTYVADGSVVPDAPERLIDRLIVPDGPAAGYAGHAVIAEVCRAAGRPNPYAAEWAHEYVEMARWCATTAEGEAAREAYELKSERLFATISADALAAALRDAGVSGGLARRIAGHAGRPEAADMLGAGQLHTKPPTTGRPAPATVNLAPPARGAGHIGGVFDELRARSSELISTTDVVRAREIAFAAMARSDDDATGRAGVLAWLARTLIDMGRPQAAVEALGEAAGPWEEHATTLARQELMLLRSTASMWAMPDHVAGLVASTWSRHAEAAGTSPGFVRLFNRHAAEELMRMGGPDRAAELLGPQARREAARPDGDPRVVMDLARALGACGRHVDALRAIRQALGMVRAGELNAELVDALRARSLAATGAYRESATILFHWPVRTVAVLALIDLAAATTIIRREDPTWLRPGLKSYLWAELESAAVAAGDAGEWFTAVRCLSAMGGLGEACGLDDVMEHYWRLLLQTADDHGYPPDAEALAWLAARAFRRGELAAGRQHLVRVSMGLASLVGAVRDVSALAQPAHPLRAPLTAAMDALAELTPAPLPLMRSVAEMQRDIVARAQAVKGGLLTEAFQQELTDFDVRTGELPRAAYGRLVEDAATTVLDSTMDDEFLRALAPSAGVVGIVEWITPRSGAAMLLTTVADDGTVGTVLLAPPEVDLPGAARKVASRLAGWWLARDGDPLEWAPWRRVEGWLVERLTEAFGRRPAHVVFIEPPWAGLPWHLACASRWTCSYVSGWTALLELVRRPATPAPRAAAVLAAPALDESDEVVRAFDASVQRHRALASDALSVSEHVGGAADAEAFRAAMAGADVVKILCHGLVSPTDSEVALMLAAEGHLPPAHAVAAAGQGTARYRVSWRDCQRLPRAASTVYSAACSTGQGHPAAWGDRSSLFRALRPRGTRTFVGPRWDAIAPVVLPIIDEVIERTLDGGEPVAAAVESASATAERRYPPWAARVLAVEGDWRQW